MGVTQAACWNNGVSMGPGNTVHMVRPLRSRTSWRVESDSARIPVLAGHIGALLGTGGNEAEADLVKADETISLAAKALLVLRAYTEPTIEPDHSTAASVASIAESNQNAEADPSDQQLSDPGDPPPR